MTCSYHWFCFFKWGKNSTYSVDTLGLKSSWIWFYTSPGITSGSHLGCVDLWRCPISGHHCQRTLRAFALSWSSPVLCSPDFWTKILYPTRSDALTLSKSAVRFEPDMDFPARRGRAACTRSPTAELYLSLTHFGQEFLLQYRKKCWMDIS